MIDLILKHFSVALHHSFYTDDFENGIWCDLEIILTKSMEEVLLVEDIEPDQLPDMELTVDVLLATDSFGSAKQFQNKDIDINSRNVNVGKMSIVNSVKYAWIQKMIQIFF